MMLESLLHALGAPVQSPEEETFELFAQALPSQNLGFIDSRAATLELSIAGRDFTIHQSPGVLASNRAGGTTGAVVWKITPLFAEWLGCPDNLLFGHGVLSRSSLVLELGCGVSGLVALLLAPRVSLYVLTDQPYVARLVEQNLAENQRAAFAASVASATSSPLSPASPPSHPASRSASAGRTSSKSRAATPASTPKSRGYHAPKVSRSRDRDRDRDRHANANANANANAAGAPPPRIRFTPLDWETDEVTAGLLTGSPAGEPRSLDVVLACDCVYNEALIEPFVSTCVDLCRLRVAEADEAAGAAGAGSKPKPKPRPAASGAGLGLGPGLGSSLGLGNGQGNERGKGAAQPTVCVIAQQLRDPLVFEAWLTRFGRSFHTWRVPDGLLVPGLLSDSGFVVHVGVLRESIDLEAV